MLGRFFFYYQKLLDFNFLLTNEDIKKIKK